MHTLDETDEHYSALHLMQALTDTLGLTTFLDVGAGTGRGVRYFLDRKGGFRCRTGQGTD
jgi:hypothetical protein